MITFWICVVLGVIFIVMSSTESDKDERDACIGIGVTFILLFSWFIPSFIGNCIMKLEYKETEVTKRTAELLCLKDNFKLSGGSMFVGISQSMNYYYYTQDPDGAITLNNIPVRAVKLYEDAPPGVGYALERWTIVEDVEHSKWVFNVKPPNRLTQREIHVPPNTVLRQFALDAE